MSLIPIPNDSVRAAFSSRVVPPPQGGPAFGPRPELVVPDEAAEDLAASSRKLHSDPRKRKAWERFLIYSEAYAPLVVQRIFDEYSDPETKRQLERFVDLSVNLALDVTLGTCVVWKHPAQRTIRDASDDALEAFQELVKECRFGSVSKALNRQAWYLGPTTAVPVMRGGKMTHDVLLPHFYDTIQNPEDPWGNPLAAGWDVQLPSGHLWAMAPDKRPEAGAVVLDAESYRYYSISDKTKIVATVPHGIGEFPGSTLRFDHTHATSWWGCDRHERLTHATIAVSVIQSALGFVRKSQNKWLLAITGNLSGVPAGQKLDPETPISGNAESPQLINFQTLNFDTDPKNFISHAVWIMNTVARSYGADLASGTTVDSGGSAIGADVKFSYEAQTELRNEQIPFARDFERDLWAKTIAVAKANRWRLADKLPDPEEFRDAFEVIYPPLSRTFASPQDEIAYRTYELQHGIRTYGDLLMNDMPDATPDQRHQQVLDNIKKQGEVVEELTKRDQSRAGMPGDPKLETPAQQFGAQGPKVRDGKAPPPEEKDEEKVTDE